MTYTVYIIYSEKTQKYYVGQTDNFNKRLERHNLGLVKSTKTGIIWRVIHTISCETRSESIVLESKIKKRGISRFLIDNNLELA
jgi:putative endonuclease